MENTIKRLEKELACYKFMEKYWREKHDKIQAQLTMTQNSLVEEYLKNSKPVVIPRSSESKLVKDMTENEKIEGIKKGIMKKIGLDEKSQNASKFIITVNGK